MDVLTAPDRAELGTALADAIDADHASYERDVFPDGERYVRGPASLDDHVVLVGDLRPNDLLVETVIALDALRETGGDRVDLAVPYLAYARQDRVFEPGEGISARAVLQALGTQADAVVTVDVHAEHVLDHFPGPARSASAMPEIADALADRSVTHVLAPDAGALEQASVVAQRLAVPVDHLEKTRISATEVQVAPKELDVSGGSVAIVDDIISTGGTMATATRQLLDAGADRVLVAATHGILASGAEKRLQDAGVDEILVTDTVPGPRAVIPAADALARALQQLPGT